jgi:hypothetical protein
VSVLNQVIQVAINLQMPKYMQAHASSYIKDVANLPKLLGVRVVRSAAAVVENVQQP